MTEITIAFRNAAGSSSTPAWARNDSVAVPPTGSVYADLLDVAGVATGVSLSCSAAFNGQGGNTAYAIAGAGGWPEDVFERHTFISANQTRTLTFSGLPASTDVTLEIAGHRGASAGRDLYFTWGGNAGFWDQSGTTTPTAPTSVVGTTDGSGNIALVVQSTTVNDTVYVNGMKLTYEGGGGATVFDYYVADSSHNTAKIATRAPAGGAVAIEYSVNSDFSSSTTTSTTTANSGNNYTVQIALTGLSANTVYYYRGVLDGSPDNTYSTTIPKFKTAPSGVGNIKFALSSCANTGSTSDVFGRIRARNPDVFIHHGDFHYEDINAEDLPLKRAAYLDVLTSVEQNKLYKQTNLWYRYDDHDFGANNSDATNVGRVSSAAAIREIFPQSRVNSSGAVYAVTTRGRVRFIQLDVRYEKASNTLLGTTQLSWLLSTLTAAAGDVAAGTIALVIVDVSVPWIAASTTDSWSDATAERTTISNHIFTEGLEDNIVFVAGDMHGTAYDDGTNNIYATGAPVGWPVIQSGSLDRTVSTKGGPYTTGPFATNTGQYTVMDITDSGSQITVDLTGYTLTDTVLYTASFSTPITSGIDSYPATVRSGATGVAYTTTGLSAVSGITIGALAATSVSDTAGDGTHAIPALTDETAHELYGTKTVTFTGTGGAPTTSTSFQPLSTQSFVTLSGTLNTTNTGVLYNFSPAAAVGDQIVWTTANGAVDAQGNYAGDFDGTQTMWHIDATDNVARSYDVITGPPGDTTPTTFTFTDQTNVALSTLTESNTITVAGIDTASAISVTGGEYAVNTGSGFGAFTSSSTTVENGNTVKVRHTSSGSFSTAVNTVLTIGGVSDTFTTTTLAADTTPNSFTFTDVTNASLSTEYTSNSITVTGLNTSSAISISGGTYSKNGGAYTASSGTVVNGDTVTVRINSSGSYSTAVNTTLTIGGVSDTYTVTTDAAPSVPPTMPADTSANVAENSTVVGTYAALSGSSPIAYSLSGTDAALFSINSSSGAVAFLSAPNFESGSNTKNITVTATNAHGSDSQSITVNITNVVESPVMPADNTYIVIEGQTIVSNPGASFVDGDITYSKSGTDQALFNVNSTTGALTFISPAEIGSYSVTVTATNSAGNDAQVLTVNVIAEPVLSGKRSLFIGIGIGIGL